MKLLLGSKLSESAQDERSELPTGWTWAKLGHLAQVVGGGTPRRDRQEFYEDGAIPWATPTDIDQDRILAINQTTTRITEIGLLKSSAQLLPAGTVLFSSRASIGKIGIAARPMATNQGFANFIPSESLDALYLAYCLRRFTEDIIALASGTTYLEVSKSALREFAIPVPPLAEQRRIVAKIEALFEQSRTARQALDRIPSLLKKFRQAVLAATFRGDLTRDWREQNPEVEPASALLERIRAERRRKWEANLRAKGKHPRKVKYEEPKPVDTTDLPELPEGWIWVSLGRVLELVQYGTSVKASASAATGMPILRMGNIQDGRLDLKDLKYIDPQDEDIAKYTLERGDVLINRTNSPELVGKAALFSCDGTYVFASYLIRLRPYLDAALPAFINFVINSQVGRRHVQSVKHQVAGQANINTDDICSMPLPLPPLEEQKEIVAKIEGLFARADAIEAAVDAARRRAEKLEQSILARAFRGELVPQDSTDEPAPVLLKRIHADREKGGTAKRQAVGSRRD